MDKKKQLYVSLIFLLLILFAGCSGRHNPPVISGNGTLAYHLVNDVTAQAEVSFFKAENKETGLPLRVDTIFTLNEKDYLRVRIPVDKFQKDNWASLMFHLDWVGHDGKSFYTKRIDFSPNDSSFIINSSVSLSPEKREAGRHTLKLYYFRELIAEKNFLLLPKNSINQTLAAKLNPEIVFCEKVGKKTGDRLGIDTVFNLGKKARVRAFVDMDNIKGFKDEKLLFDLVWIGPDGGVFYSKDIELSPTDDEPQLYSSISIPPDKRESGKYALEVYLFEELIAMKKFTLK